MSVKQRRDLTSNFSHWILLRACGHIDWTRRCYRLPGRSYNRRTISRLCGGAVTHCKHYTSVIRRVKRLLQLRFDLDSTMIRLRRYDSTSILLRFDSSKWASWQYVNEGMNSYRTTFYFGSVWKGYTNVDNRRMLPNVDPSAWMPFLLPWCTLICLDRWLRRFSTRRKNEHVHFLS